MPKFLFYAGTAFCFFVALIGGAEAARAFFDFPPALDSAASIALALAAGLAIAALFMRMAALLAARNLFAALMAVLSVACATTTLAAVLLLRWRAGGVIPRLEEVQFAVRMSHGFFVALSLLSLRPYFSIQASRFLSALVFFPLPLFLLVLGQEMFELSAPASARSVFFSVVALLFASIAVHCIRHRHLFLEMTNLRELLDARVDPARSRAIGGVAFDS